MKRVLAVLTAAAIAFMASPVLADPAAPMEALAAMPVKEITVFKDGNALILHQGKMQTDANGNVLMDYLPSPVLGTFWPFSAEKGVKLTSVVSGQRKVKVERTALGIRELIEANVGASVHITETSNGKETAVTYEATILGVPVRSGEELEATSPPGTGERLPLKGGVVLLTTTEGTKVVDIGRIQDITLKGAVKPKVADEEFRNLLTLKLDWAGKKAGPAEVGLMYLQRSIRWIPNYKVTIDGKGTATVKLEATLINEMTDLKDVTANLVIGVPTFEFKDTLDPIGLQQALAQLSSSFRNDANSRLSMSNSIMVQTQAFDQNYNNDSGGEGGARAAAARGAGTLGPEIGAGTKSEDLYVFPVKHITLKKGQRMVLPVAEFTLSYKDVYVLDVAASPPPELRGNLNNEQLQVMRMMSAPKVMHKIRLTNKSEYPLTTAPAMIFTADKSGDKVLGQGMMTYAATGGEEDLAITTAIDIKVKKTEAQTARTPNAATFNSHQYFRIDLEGKLVLTNFRTDTVEIEVVRNVLGNVTAADHDGKIEAVNMLEDMGTGASPTWLSSYSWPYWWHHFNGIGRMTWKFKLEPGKSIDLGYSWNYFWE